MFFWNSLAFSMIQRMLAIWSLVPLPFLNPAWTSGSSHTAVLILLKPNLKDFEHYLASMWNECNCTVLWTFIVHTMNNIGIVLLWDWNDFFFKVTQSCLTLCDPMDYTVWNSLGQNTGVGSLSLLQGIFPTQGLNPGLPHCRWILY